MRCLVCGAEMRVVEVAADDTMRVSGYEYHTLQCSGCDDIERRLVFSREATVRPAKPAPPPPPQVQRRAPPRQAAPRPPAPLPQQQTQLPPPPPRPPPQQPGLFDFFRQ